MAESIKDPALRQIVSAGLEKQKAFGWTIAWAIFLGGSGGGTFLVSAFPEILHIGRRSLSEIAGAIVNRKRNNKIITIIKISEFPTAKLSKNGLPARSTPTQS